ncbi:MAG: hypothetical protein ACRD4E_17360, partial [Bryobacteraceae bacterium]
TESIGNSYPPKSPKVFQRGLMRVRHLRSVQADTSPFNQVSRPTPIAPGNSVMLTDLISERESAPASVLSRGQGLAFFLLRSGQFS